MIAEKSVQESICLHLALDNIAPRKNPTLSVNSVSLIFISCVSALVTILKSGIEVKPVTSRVNAFPLQHFIECNHY